MKNLFYYVQMQLDQNRKFNLYLFPEKTDSYECVLATWDGIFDTLSKNDPEIYERLKKFKNDFMTKSFDEIESKSDFDWMKVENVGISHEKYMGLLPKNV